MTGESKTNRLSEPGIEVLPDGCIAHAISLTSPRDACCLSAVSTAFRSAAASDSVWNSFLPSDLEPILSRADRPVDFSSKRELYFRLCDQPILLDGGKMIFSLDRSSGAKCFMLSARELDIKWADTDRYWRWVPEPDFRFSEVAELLHVCWLEIRGHFQSKMLSSKTTYAAYLIFKLSGHAYNLDHPLEASVKLGTKSSTSIVCLRPGKHRHAWRSKEWFWCQRLRYDGWMEIELGEFYNSGEEDEEVAVSLWQVMVQLWRNRLIIEGIEIRPKSNAHNFEHPVEKEIQIL